MAILLTFCSSETERIFLEVEKKQNIDLSLYPWAQEEIKEHVEACGPGVITGVEGANKCGYQVEVDELMLRHPSQKTGLLHDENWAYKKGVVFEMPTKMQAPDKWDLRDQMTSGQPRVNKQECGDCWAQATAKGFELYLAANTKKLLDFSVQCIIDCPPDFGSCGGGYMSAPDFLIKNGADLLSDHPYKGYNSNCPHSSDELKVGFEHKLKAAPYVGTSKEFSRFYLFNDAPERDDKMDAIKAMMVQHNSPAVVTISAIGSSGGVITSCSNLNSGGNHMQDIVGWEKSSDYTVAHVWNSWGTGHGQNGVTYMRWDCSGGLNRGLGRSARVYVGDVCDPQPELELPVTSSLVKLDEKASIVLGAKKEGQSCKWAPEVGLTYLDESKCLVSASPDISTEYHVDVTTKCATRSMMSLVKVFSAQNHNRKTEPLLTPHGIIKEWDGR